MRKKISIALPVITIAVLFLFLLRPEMTGFVTITGDVPEAKIKVTITEGVFIPENSTVYVITGQEISGMPISVFIEKSSEPHDLVEGQVPEIGYKGLGYTGNHNYIVPISEFNLSDKIKGENIIEVKILYNGFVLSRNVSM
jgi:hypothetical protein